LTADLTSLRNNVTAELATMKQAVTKAELTVAALKTSIDKEFPAFEKRLAALEAANKRDYNIAGRLAAVEAKSDNMPKKGTLENLMDAVDKIDKDVDILAKDLAKVKEDRITMPGPIVEGNMEDCSEEELPIHGEDSGEGALHEEKHEPDLLPTGPMTAGTRGRRAMEAIRGETSSVMSGIRFTGPSHEVPLTTIHEDIRERGRPGEMPEMAGIENPRGASGFGGHGFGGNPYNHADMPRHSNPLYEEHKPVNLKMPAPEKFSGKKVGQNVGLWLRQVQRYAAAMRYSPSQTLSYAVGLLTDAALVWADNKHALIEQHGWPYLEQGLMDQFQVVDLDTATRDKLENLAFQPGGDIVKFIQTFREYLLQIPSMTEREALQYFQRAMPADVRQFLRLNMEGASLDAIYHKLQTLASLQASIGTTTGSLVPSLVPKNRAPYVGGNGSGIGDAGKSSQPPQNGNGYGSSGHGGWKGGNKSPRYNAPNRRNRGRQGKQPDTPHSVKAATEKSPRKKEKTGGRTCYACGESDHTLSVCPLWAQMREQLKASNTKPRS
jgi:hypothetical protein